MKLYHQCGYNTVWNIESIVNDSAGEGVIFSPKHENTDKIQKFYSEIDYRNGIFDPQFFLPNQVTGKLTTYDFFPGKISQTLNASHYSSIAELCVKFQVEHQFEYIIIPTPITTLATQQEIDCLENSYISPFIRSYQGRGVKKPLLLQIVLNQSVFSQVNLSTDLLNWITGIQEIDGVYLILEVNPRSKQLQNHQLLFEYMKFIDSLKKNSLFIVLGYLNTESIVLSLASPDIITMGSYEKTRIFRGSNFQLVERTPQQGPRARVFSSKLFQWIDHSYTEEIINRLGSEIFDKSNYQVLLFNPDYHWHFNKPELYKHYFVVFHNYCSKLNNYQDEERFQFLHENLRTAKSLYEQLEDIGIYLDQESSGNHIGHWLTAISSFANYKGWN